MRQPDSRKKYSQVVSGGDYDKRPKSAKINRKNTDTGIAFLGPVSDRDDTFKLQISNNIIEPQEREQILSSINKCGAVEIKAEK